MSLEDGVHGAAADSQALGGQFLIPAAFFQNIQQQAEFLIGNGGREAWGGLMEGGGQIPGLQYAALSQDDGVFNGIFQFSDVARPGVIQQEPHGSGTDLPEVLATLLGETPEEVEGQPGDIVSAVSQRGQHNG